MKNPPTPLETSARGAKQRHAVRGVKRQRGAAGRPPVRALREPQQTSAYHKRLVAYWFGRAAEARVIVSLIMRGYSIKAWRYRTPVGEIDIVATRGQTLILIEVKARRTHDAARESLSPRQQDRLKRAASYLLSSHPHYASRAIRFDCCTVTWYMRVDHLAHAFD